MESEVTHETVGTPEKVTAGVPVQDAGVPLQDKARWRKMEIQLADYRDALAGMAAELRDRDRKDARHELEKAELAASLADLERENARLRGQLQAAEFASRQVKEQLAEAIRAVQVQALDQDRASAARLEELERALHTEQRAGTALRAQLRSSDQAIGELRAALELRRTEAVPAASTPQATAGSGEQRPEPLAAGPVAPLPGGTNTADNVPDAPRNDALLVSLDGDESVRHPLFKSVMVIGRSSGADLRIAGPRTSRRHARVVVRGETVTIEDMGSLNGTIVNDQLVRRQELRNGDVLDLGGARLQFVNLQAASSAPAAVETEST